jgi:hypothetical protein
LKVPAQIFKGDSAKWDDEAIYDGKRNLILPSDWTLKVVFNGPTKLTLTSSELNGGWTTEITATQSGNLTVGVYYWQAFATKDDQRITIDEGQLKVEANLDLEVSGFDGRSQTQKDLDAVQDAIRSLISGGAVQEYKINNREMKKMTLGELRNYESSLKYKLSVETRRQKIKNGEGDPLTLKIGF